MQRGLSALPARNLCACESYPPSMRAGIGPLGLLLAFFLCEPPDADSILRHSWRPARGVCWCRGDLFEKVPVSREPASRATSSRRPAARGIGGKSDTCRRGTFQEESWGQWAQSRRSKGRTHTRAPTRAQTLRCAVQECTHLVEHPSAHPVAVLLLSQTCLLRAGASLTEKMVRRMLRGWERCARAVAHLTKNSGSVHLHHHHQKA